MDKEILKDITYGIYIVSSKNVGCIINTLMQITSKDSIISISLNKDNYTNKIIKENKKFIVSIIPEGIDKNIISTFGFKSSKDVDKFENFDFTYVNGTKVIKDTIGYLECEVVNVIDCNTHDIFLAKVINTKKYNNDTPMTYKYYKDIVKGVAPKLAPTYIEEEIKDCYVCDVCGYVHFGPLPDDFVCPICGVSRKHFKKR